MPDDRGRWSLDEQLMDLQLRLHDLEGVVGRVQSQAVDSCELEGSSGDGRVPWSLEGLDQGRLDHHVESLCVWVDWANEIYRLSTGDCIPACWHRHSGLVAELLTLHESWRMAFLRPKTVELAQRWHEVSLPSFISRLPTYLGKDCLAGHHPTGDS